MKLVLDRIKVRLGGAAILDDFSLAIEARGITAIMGPSGIGKTTLLRLIAGFVKPETGTRQVEAKVATIFQDARLLPWQSALDNAGFGLRAQGYSRQAARAQTAALLGKLGLSPEDQSKLPRALSGGMQRRIAIARALAVQPDLLLMDEPFTGLDMTLRDELYALVRRIVDEQHLAAILVTHDPVEAATLAERVIVLGGRPARQLADIAVPRRPHGPADAYEIATWLMRQMEQGASTSV